jgi:hypothetical protein
MTMSIKRWWPVLAVLLGGSALAEEPGRLQGHILGRQCAEAGRIGECYLKWADDVVFRNTAGEILRIDLAASGIRQERLDEAYGLEVELYGKVLRDGQGVRVGISQLNIVKPPGSKEFFKG